LKEDAQVVQRRQRVGVGGAEDPAPSFQRVTRQCLGLRRLTVVGEQERNVADRFERIGVVRAEDATASSHDLAPRRLGRAELAL
jgi:hypothetical protein